MVVIAVIGVLAFLIGLIVRAPLRQQAAARRVRPSRAHSPRWYEFTLALILLAAIAAFAIWLISSGSQWVWGETIERLAIRHARDHLRRSHGGALAVVGLASRLPTRWFSRRSARRRGSR
jgi:NADH:ubiquinone oxidoreductase subunit 5 (subunit L)/multisubunit Na+/H+ antiporter MnhA subunit